MGKIITLLGAIGALRQNGDIEHNILCPYFQAPEVYCLRMKMFAKI